MSDDKPFVCTAPGCGQRFTNEDHLSVHKHKHEMTLKFGPARNDSVIVADQTPTPTRFLKNCEEVGLFNELASPFENDFKKVSDDDTKKCGDSQGKELGPMYDAAIFCDRTAYLVPFRDPGSIEQMPLDLSPLATPVVRHKIEESIGVEATHQDSPLPHPESTTSDEKNPHHMVHDEDSDEDSGNPPSIHQKQRYSKELSELTVCSSPLPLIDNDRSDDDMVIEEEPMPQPAQPTPAIVRPASLQVPSVLLANSDSSVIIQHASPSPTSSTVITQAPPSNRAIVPVRGAYPVLLHLPNGRTMPVAIPAAITNANVHVPASVPIVGPVTVVPNVPGIPGPSSPPPVPSEAKMRLKAALTQQHSQVMNGETIKGQVSGLPKAQVEEIQPHSLQQPATSTTETPASPAQPTPPAQSTGGRRRRAASDDPDEKRRKFLERNRAAASRCRQKRKVWVQSLEKKAEDLSSFNVQLQNEVTLLRNEVAQLKQLLLAHKDCPVTALQKKTGYHPTEKEDSSEDLSMPSSPLTEAIQHSSVSTSNGVSSTSMAEAVATSVLAQLADQSTEPVLCQLAMGSPSSQSQSSGS